MNPLPSPSSNAVNPPIPANRLTEEGRRRLALIRDTLNRGKHERAEAFEDIRQNGWLDLVKEFIRRYRQNFEANIAYFSGTDCDHLCSYLSQKIEEIIAELCHILPTQSPLELERPISDLRAALIEASRFAREFTEFKDGKRYAKPHTEVWLAVTEPEASQRKFDIEGKLEQAYAVFTRLHAIASRLNPSPQSAKRRKAGRKRMEEGNPSLRKLYLAIVHRKETGEKRRSIIAWLKREGIRSQLKDGSGDDLDPADIYKSALELERRRSKESEKSARNRASQ